MFEKRLQAFSYAVGMTFIVLAALNVVNFIVYSLMLAGPLANVWPFCTVGIGDVARYMLNLKLMGVFFGAVFLVSYIWGRRLRKTSS